MKVGESWVRRSQAEWVVGVAVMVRGNLLSAGAAWGSLIDAPE
jgi:hypothetical protein